MTHALIPEEAERDVIGCAILSADLRREALGRLTAGEFADFNCRDAFAALERLHADGRAVDVATVADEARVDATWLRGILAELPASANVAAYSAIVALRAYGRRLRDDAVKVVNVVNAGDVLEADRLLRRMLDVPPPQASIRPAVDAHELARTDFTQRWLVEGLMERADRVMVVGGEGRGKSLLLRQMAVQLASGIQPFTLDRCPRQTVLIVDLENSEAQVARSLKVLLGKAGADYQRGSLFVKCRPQGMDLTRREDSRWLMALVAHHAPDVLVFGSLYKAYRGTDGRSKSSEEAAELVAHELDTLRVACDCTLLIEAHAPHGEQGDRAGWRPAGSSLWLRWPEVGLGMKPPKRDERGQRVVEVVQWRGFRDRDRASHWPDTLVEGDRWPWERA